MSVRRASHAGSWYTDDGEQLDRQLQGWLDAVPAAVKEIPEAAPGGREGSKEEEEEEEARLPLRGVRAIIGPHAGLEYSGATAAFAYKSIATEGIRRVFVLGPSHHVYLKQCALSQCAEYETPLGSMAVDRETIAELRRKSPEWGSMGLAVDEDEHSLEMHLPYIYKQFERRIDEVKLVPILVGNLSLERERAYGRLLAEYLEDEENLFVVSSDFCHWGSRFRYTRYRESDGARVVSLSAAKGLVSGGVPIWKSIERLDFDGMQAIARLDHAEFRRYLDETENTVCGRHPIGVLLGAVAHLHPEQQADSSGRKIGDQGRGPQLRFVKYAQSSRVRDASDSSVSYASAYLRLPPKDA